MTLLLAIFVLHYLFTYLFLMASHDFSSIKSPPKFGGLNFPIWKVKMILFLKSIGVRVTKAISKEIVEPHGDENT